MVGEEDGVLAIFLMFYKNTFQACTNYKAEKQCHTVKQ